MRSVSLSLSIARVSKEATEAVSLARMSRKTCEESQAKGETREDESVRRWMAREEREAERGLRSMTPSHETGGKREERRETMMISLPSSSFFFLFLSFARICSSSSLSYRSLCSFPSLPSSLTHDVCRRFRCCCSAAEAGPHDGDDHRFLISCFLLLLLCSCVFTLSHAFPS